MTRAMDHHIAQLGHLVAELSDAHLDTIEIASGYCRDQCRELEWESHIEYLQRLCRVAEEALANTTAMFAMAAIPSVPDLDRPMPKWSVPVSPWAGRRARRVASSEPPAVTLRSGSHDPGTAESVSPVGDAVHPTSNNDRNDAQGWR